jgi:GMP synthase (glutamine-hydrolysing)
MKSAIAIRHVHFEDLGVLGPLLRERGYDVRYVDAPTEDLTAIDAAAPDLMVVLGGPIGAFDDGLYPFVADEAALCGRRLKALRPLIGICLGGQLIARALGARVASMGAKEIGFSPLTLTDDGRRSPLARIGDRPVLHWHGDQFDIPAGARRLASTEICANQAFAVGLQVLALQFHLEADEAGIERWLVGHASELGQAGVDPREIRRQARAFGADLAAAARDVIGQWLDLAEAEEDVLNPAQGRSVRASAV